MNDTCTTGERTWILGSTEYLKYLVTADVALDAQTVAFSFDRVTWLTAEWTGTDTVVDDRHQRVAQRLVTDADLPDGLSAGDRIQFFIRITDNPEAPIVPAGDINII